MIFVKERYESYQLDLENRFSLLSIKGDDAEGFLSSGLTSNVKELSENRFHISARLNRLGKITAYGYLLKKNSYHYYFLIEKAAREIFISDLKKFIVMEDVSIKHSDKTYAVEWPSRHCDFHENSFCGYFWGEDARILLEQSSTHPVLDKDQCRKIRKCNGHFLWDEMPWDVFINETYLNETAVDYKKGCFLGQETAAKIYNNRGGAYFPVLLQVDKDIEETQGTLTVESQKFGLLRNKIKLDDKIFLIASVKREFRINNKTFSLSAGLTTFQGKVLSLPLFDDKTLHQKGQELYVCGIDHFKNNREAKAIALLEKSVLLAPNLEDAYESLGVIFGRQGRYEKAVSLMDKLLEINEHSIMAHTNKSLYFMKMGKIREAEEEKALATVKSFQRFGKESENKKMQEESKRKEAEDMAQKEKMFLNVLDIDAHDTIANFGLGEIALKRQEYSKAKNFLEHVIKANKNYSKAYLLLGKSLEFLGDKIRAKSVYEQGVTVASKRGEMMPANEMQERLLNLSR